MSRSGKDRGPHPAGWPSTVKICAEHCPESESLVLTPCHLPSSGAACHLLAATGPRRGPRLVKPEPPSHPPEEGPVSVLREKPAHRHVKMDGEGVCVCCCLTLKRLAIFWKTSVSQGEPYLVGSVASGQSGPRMAVPPPSPSRQGWRETSRSYRICHPPDGTSQI